MKVLELLDELQDIVETSPNLPLTTKIMVEADDILSVVRDIRKVLPEEIQTAQRITEDESRIIDKAKTEYTSIVNEAKNEAESLIETDIIVQRARQRADEIMKTTEDNCKNLKLSTIEYIDGLLYDFQNKMDSLNATYFREMYNNIQNTFEQIEDTVNQNRGELKDLLYQTNSEK